MDIHDLSLFRRIFCSLSPHIRTWWGNHPMFPSTSVGWSGLSCFSLAICGPGAHGCREGPFTRTARTTSKSNSCSTAPSSPWFRVCPGGGPTEAMGVQNLCAPSRTPILYVRLAADVLGRVPLTPLFLLGNYTPTISHQLCQHRSARFPLRLADAAEESGRKGNNVYEINQWLWQFGRGKPRLGPCRWLRLRSGT